jgi:hypothetical protein
MIREHSVADPRNTAWHKGQLPQDVIYIFRFLLTDVARRQMSALNGKPDTQDTAVLHRGSNDLYKFIEHLHSPKPAGCFPNFHVTRLVFVKICSGMWKNRLGYSQWRILFYYF